MKKKTMGFFVVGFMLLSSLFGCGTASEEGTNLNTEMNEISSEVEEIERETQAEITFANDLEDWDTNGTVSLEEDDEQGETVAYLSGKNTSISKTVTGLVQGSYTVKVWLKGTTSNNGAKVMVTDTGGPDSVIKTDALISDEEWTQVAHRNVLVYNGQMTVSVNTGSSGAELYVATIEISNDSQDENTVRNWDFEEGTENWKVEGEVVADAENADTGEYALKLSDQSEISQVISVTPNTDYIATVRLKVEEEDTYSQELQNSYDESSIIGVYVQRETLGDRVNLGVRGLDGTVLRQAPASTEGYSLVTIAFHTRENETSVELYVNTKYDQNYLDSITVYENTSGYYENGYQKPNPEETDCTVYADEWTTNGDHFAWVDNVDVFQINNDYVKGADVSFLQAIEDCGGKYFANGVQQDMLRILSNHGVNSITCMALVHAGNEVYTWSDLQLLTTSTVGYEGEEVSGRQMIEGYFDETHCTALALRAQELGLSYTQSFHYSDTWVSAAKAHIPLDFLDETEEELENPDITMLETAVYNYVYDFLTNMKDSGVDNLIMVKNGNEQDGGLVFPVAMGSKYAEHAAIISASSNAVSKVYPEAINLIHTNTGYSTSQFQNFFQNLLNYGAEYDGMAFSFYGGRGVSNLINMLETASDDETFKWYDYINVETGMSFTKNAVISDSESAMAVTANYDVSMTGQYNWLLDYIQASLDVPNETGILRGFYYWNAEAIAVYGAGHKTGEAVAGTKRTLFNNGTESIQAMGSNEPGKMGDMSLAMYAYLNRGYSKEVDAELSTSLGETTSYEVCDVESLSFLEEELSLNVGETSRVHTQLAPVDSLYTDYSVSFVSSDEKVAKVSKYGYVTGVSAGEAIITATVGNVSNSLRIVVTETETAQDMNLEYETYKDGVLVESGEIEDGMELSVEALSKVKIYLSLDEDADDREVIFSMNENATCEFYGETWQTDITEIRTLATTFSSNEYAPIVQLNTLSAGSVDVTAESNDKGVAISFTLDVFEVSMESIEITGNDTIVVGDTSIYTATIIPDDATFSDISWSSSDESILTIADGVASGKSVGVATIIATSSRDSSIYAEKTVEVVEIQATELILSRSSFGLLVGDSVSLNATVLPSNAANKEIIWSQSEASKSYFSVDSDGCVIALQEGEGTVYATCAGNEEVVVTCKIYVQTEAVEVENIVLSEESYYFVSSYFSESDECQVEEEPVHALSLAFYPENATYVDTVWVSDNEAVATVDAEGVVTAHKNGVAEVQVTVEESELCATANIYVPQVSEDFENYEVGDTSNFIDSNTFTYSIIEDSSGNHVLQAAVEGKAGGWKTGSESISRHSFEEEITGEVVIVDFDWNVGEFVADSAYRGGNISIEDGDGNTYLALTTYPSKSGTTYGMTYYLKDGSTAMPTHNGDVNGDFNYVHGGAVGTYTDCVLLSDALSGENEEYHVHVEVDFVNKTIRFSVTDMDNQENSVTVSDIALDESISYTDGIGAIAFSHLFKNAASWYTTIDNLAVYSTSVLPEELQYEIDCINYNSVTGIKIVPVEGALSSTAQIYASVIPAAADQTVVFEVSEELQDIIQVDENGYISVIEEQLVSYDNQDAIEEKSGYISFYAEGNTSIVQTVPVTVGKPNASEVIQVYVDNEEYTEEISVIENTTLILTYSATGGDGISDVYSYSFEVISGDAMIEGNELTVGTAGLVEVAFTIDLFRGEETIIMYFQVTAEE